MSQTLQMAGPLCSADIIPFIATTDLAVTLSPSPDFPVSPVIRPILLRDFALGRGGLLQLLGMPRHRAVASTPPRRHPYRSVFGCSCGLRPPVEGLALGETAIFEATMCHFCYGPETGSLSTEDFVERLQSFSFHHLCYRNYGALTSTRQVCLLLKMPAFAGTQPDRQISASSSRTRLHAFAHGMSRPTRGILLQKSFWGDKRTF